MKPDDVTNKMIERVSHLIDFHYMSDRSKQVAIAAAWNAVVSDDSPITAEWLVKNGYEASEFFSNSFRHVEERKLNVWFDSSDEVNVAMGETSTKTKTIGQLRALHAGLGIGEVGS